MEKYRQRLRFEYLYRGKSREQYVRICKNMGITDVCECEPADLVSTHRRPASGVNGIAECKECLCIVHPLMYMYACDECTEPALADKHFLPTDVDFICDDCLFN